MAPPSSSSAPGEGLGPDLVVLVQRHLEKVLASKAFAGSKRSQDFLRLIIEHALAGRLDNLRERMIGAEMFGRPIDYDTANDAVVRVKANEVRRRLAQYYADEGTDSDALWIELPTGAYVPEFHWKSTPKVAEPQTSTDLPLPPAPSRHVAGRRWVWLLGAVAAAAALVAAYWLPPVVSPAPLLPRPLIRLTFDSGYTTDGEISADGKLIAYASDRDSGGNLDIYVQEIQRGSIARFTDDPADDYDPAFSPDGTQIAFRSERNGGGIYEMSTLRGRSHLVVAGGRHPRFSPDGRYLLYWQSAGAFSSRWGELGASLFTVELAGGSPVEVSRNCNFVGTGAAWSPDSKRILFAGVCQGQSGVWLASPDGKTLESSSLYKFWKEQKLRSLLEWTTAPVFDQWLDRPPRLHMPLAKGDDIAYEASLPIEPDGSRPAGPLEPLVFGPSRVTHSSASQDGRIIILSAEEQTSNVWMLNVDSSGRALGSPVPLKTSSLVNYDPVLSKDGKNVVFAARESGVWELQLVKLPGGSVTRLSARLPDLREPVFNAKGDKIYYSGRLPTADHLSDYELAVESAVPETVLERSLGGIWDSSADDRWLISHGQKLVSAPVAYDDERPIRDTVVLVNRTTRQGAPFLFDPNGNLYQAHFSHDGAWVTFQSVRGQHAQIFVVRFSPHEIPIQNWIPLTDGTTWDDKPVFSFDDHLIFYVSKRDGYHCIWAQPLTGEMRPAGKAFAVYHFHSQRRSLANLPIGRVELCAGPGILVFNQGENTGNIWLQDRR